MILGARHLLFATCYLLRPIATLLLATCYLLLHAFSQGQLESQLAPKRWPTARVHTRGDVTKRCATPPRALRPPSARAQSNEEGRASMRRRPEIEGKRLCLSLRPS